MSTLFDFILHGDGTPNLVVIVPAFIVLVVVGGAVFALVHARFGPPQPVAASDWAHAAYSIWTGGEDCGEWEGTRAREALQSWYGITQAPEFWNTIDGLRQGRTGHISWDQVRAIDLLRIGTAAGYLAEHDCWRVVSQIADTLRERFDSWSTLAEDFEAGMLDWQQGRGITDPGQQQRVQRNLPYLRQTAWPETNFNAPLEL